MSTVSHCSILKQDVADVNNVTLSDRNGARFKMKSFSFLDRSKGFRLENGLQFSPRGTNMKSKSESLRFEGSGNLDTQESRDIRRKNIGSRGSLRSLPFDKWMVGSMDGREDWRNTTVELVSRLIELIKIFW